MNTIHKAIFLLFLVLISINSVCGQCVIATNALQEMGSDPQNIVCDSSACFFVSNNGIIGSELWISDGGGTRLVKDINIGFESSNPNYLTIHKGFLYFTARTNIFGTEIWRSDGSASGTSMLKDILVGSGSSDPRNLISAGQYVYFTADDGIHGEELWRSDGTFEGTFLVKDIYSGQNSSFLDIYDEYAHIEHDNRLIFSASDDSTGYELWVSDGSDTGTFQIKDIFEGPGSSRPEDFTLYNEEVYFSANYNLWKTNGDYIRNENGFIY